MLKTPARNYLWFSILLSSLLPIIFGFALSDLYPDWRWSHYPFHSMLESIGALSALTIATLMIIMIRNHHLSRLYILTACALIAMGLLDGFHAVLHAGVAFVWLHSIAAMAGGLLFATVWLPRSLWNEKRQYYLLFATIIASVLIGIISILMPENLPIMVVKGQFSSLAKAINIIGGIGFLTGTSYFIHDYYKQAKRDEYARSKHDGDIIFANHCLLFGIAALLFETSMLWDAGWWLWHILRLLAYLIVLTYFFILFNNAQTRLKNNEAKLEELNDNLELRVETRTMELAAERKLFNTTLEHASAIIIILDNKGHILRFNPAAEHITGFSFNELHNQPVWEWLIPPEQFNDIKQVFDNLTSSAMDSNYENHLMKKDGERVLVTWNNSTVTDNSGEVQYVISVGIDISERQAIQKALEQAKDAADKANMAKSDFLSRMSHELRTPMNAILGFGQMLELNAENLSEIQKGNVKEILDAGRHLLFLINEILDLTQIESGKLKILTEPVSIDKILQECTSLMQPQIEAQQVILTDNISDKNYYVQADFNRVKQVLLNLLSNAVKYNHTNGQIILHDKLISRSKQHDSDDEHVISDNKQYLRISITSSGKTLTKDEISKLFIAFERLDVINNVEGTGIGLVISKHLVELMGGMVGVESNNEGNTFWIELTLVNNSEMSN